MAVMSELQEHIQTMQLSGSPCAAALFSNENPNF
jgi:hypothetical protein